MVKTYFSEGLPRNGIYAINKYNIHKFDDDNILVTLDYGPWVLLNMSEYELLRKYRVEENPDLFYSLEDKGIIVTGNNINKAASDMSRKYSHCYTGISLHILTPTLRCNQQCIYCHSKSVPMSEKQYDMDEETAKAVVDFIFQTPSESIMIEFQGGEPLANFPIVKFIIEYAKQKNFSDACGKDGIFKGLKMMNFGLVSNMTMMDREKAEYLMKHAVRLCTSLDGPRELHNKNRPYRGGAGSYDDVVRWIDFFTKEVKYRFFSGAMPTITKNSLEYPDGIVKEYIDRGMNHVRARPLNFAGQALANINDIYYSSEEFMSFWIKYMEFIISINRRGIFFADEDIRYELNKIFSNKPFRNACLNKPCGIGTIQCAYDHKGDIYTCDEARSNDLFKLGNVKESTYREIFTSKEIANLIGLSSCTATSCDNCAWNAYCAPCLVTTYGSQGNLVSKMPSDFLCKIRGSQVKFIFEKILLSDDKKILLNFIK